jgi:hypothetical protein
MNNIYEAWQIGRNEFMCYTENLDAHHELIRFNEVFATYQHNGQIIGWHHRVRRSALVHLDSKFSERSILKNKELQALELENLPLERRSRRMAHTYVAAGG